MSLSPLGNTLSAFGKSRLVLHSYSDAVGKAVNDAVGHVGGAFDANQLDLKAFSDANRAAIDQTKALDLKNIGRYDALIDTTSRSNPFTDALAASQYKTGVLDSLRDYFANQGSARANLNASRRNGGTGGGSYDNAVFANRISSNLAPVYGHVLDSFAPDAAILNDQRLGNFAASNFLMQQQSALPGRTADLYLKPIYARGDVLGQEQGGIGNLGAIAKANTAGFSTEKDTIGKLGQAVNETTDAWTDLAKWAGSSLLSAYTGGLMGGGGGAAGGAMGAAKSAMGSAAPAFQNFQTQGAGAYGAPNWGGYQPTPAYGSANYPYTPQSPPPGTTYSGAAPNPEWWGGSSYGYRPGLNSNN